LVVGERVMERGMFCGAPPTRLHSLPRLPAGVALPGFASALTTGDSRDALAADLCGVTALLGESRLPAAARVSAADVIVIALRLAAGAGGGGGAAAAASASGSAGAAAGRARRGGGRRGRA
jgi:hypothetical protein